MSFIAELQRRKVFKVAAAYLVGAWVLVQVASILLPMFGAPTWVARSIVILLAIGFVPALIVSWMFDLTPDGFKRDSEITATPTTGPVNAARIDSIAVLPFQTRNSDEDSEYLSDGLAESLIYRLSRLSFLKVSPTSSVLRYKAKEVDPIQAGGELGVSAVMTGRFIQRGESLIISVELLDVRSGKLLWGEHYDRKLADLLATQREIATEIIQGLKLELSGPDSERVSKRYTDSNEAYQLYLKGRFHYAKRIKDDMLRGIEYFRQALAIDPRFALAHVGIADCYISLPSFSYMRSKDAHALATSAARRALEIDPTLAEAHGVIAAAMAVCDWNWAEAGREFERALELDPNVSATHFRYGLSYLAPLGRTTEAVAEIERALELEPLSLITGANLSLFYIYARRYDLALEQARKTLVLGPEFMTARLMLGFAYNANGMYDDTIALCEAESKQGNSHRWFLLIGGYAHAMAGRRKEAAGAAAQFEAIAGTESVSTYFLAPIHAALGDRDAAFAALEEAFTERDFFLPRLNVDPFLDSLHDDPRFADLVRRIGLKSAA
jgi:TolB-like protein/Tfp pilus assembly protein PilF